MIKKSVTYTDLDGNVVTEEHYFHMSKADIAKYKLKHGDMITTRIRDLIAKKDVGQMILTFEEILTDAYGVRSEDGKRFIKNAQQTEEFKQTEAYSQIFYELATGAEESADFIRGMLPADMVQDIPDLPDDPDQLLAVFDKLVDEESKQRPTGAKIIDLPLPAQTAPPLVLPPGGDGNVVETSPLGITPKKWDEYTHTEVMEMTPNEFHEIFGGDHENWPRLVLNAYFQRNLRDDPPKN